MNTQLLARLAINDDGFLFNPQTGDSFIVNTTGAEIFQHLKKGLSDMDIMALLESAYAIDANQAHSDVIDFIQQLHNYQLI